MVLVGSKAPDLTKIEKWVNGKPGRISEGVYLIDFWSYSCNECSRRSRALETLHSDSDVQVVGVHTPEFDFEEDHRNLSKAIERRNLSYPIAADSKAELWNSFGNRYWPRQVIIKDGEVEWIHSGRDNWKGMQRKLSELTGEEIEFEFASQRNRSHDIYLGFEKSNGINGHGNFKGRKELVAPNNRKQNEVYLQGKWRQESEYIEAGKDAKLFFSTNNSELHAVVNPGNSIKDVVLQRSGDVVPESEVGSHVRLEDNKSYLRAKNADSYHIASSSGQVGELVLEPERGTKLYALTTR